MRSRYDPNKDDDRITLWDVLQGIIVLASVYTCVVLFLTLGE